MSNGEQLQEASAGAVQTESAEATLIDDILGQTTYNPKDDAEAYGVASSGLRELMKQLLPQKGVKVNKALIDQMIAGLDQKLGQQVDQILHNKDFQKLESAWRGLAYLVSHTDFRQNIKIDLVNCSKDDLAADFEAEMDITKTGLYRTAYSKEYGQYGGKPYGAIISNYEFDYRAPDMGLLAKCASVSAMAHAPFISAAAGHFFGQDITKLPNMKDVKALLEGPQYAKWHSFRDTEDAKYVGLTMPRFLLRLPYGKESSPVKAFDYEETIKDETPEATHNNYSWGSAAFAFAARMTDAFAKWKWCPNIVGPKGGGLVEDLPLHLYEAPGGIQAKIPTEVMLTDRREFELSEEGFIPLTFKKDSDMACFFSANSCQKPKYFGISPEGKQAELNYRLQTRLPYTFIVTRLAHYIKVLQRENIGRNLERTDLQDILEKWIKQYVYDGPIDSLKAQRPLRAAQLSVEDVEGQAGWYRVAMKVRPHFKFEGADFELSLVGKLDKK